MLDEDGPVSPPGQGLLDVVQHAFRPSASTHPCMLILHSDNERVFTGEAVASWRQLDWPRT